MDFLSDIKNLVSERDEINTQRTQLDEKEREIIKQQEELLKKNFSIVAQVETAWEIEETEGEDLTIIFLRTGMYYEDETYKYLIGCNSMLTFEGVLPKEGYKKITWLS